MAEQCVLLDILPIGSRIQKDIRSFVCEGGNDIITTEIRMARYLRVYKQTLRSAELVALGLWFSHYLFAILKIMVEAYTACKVCRIGPLLLNIYFSTISCVLCLFKPQAFQVVFSDIASTGSVLQPTVGTETVCA